MDKEKLIKKLEEKHQEILIRNKKKNLRIKNKF
jgi:hypothetical protein